jgi:hypothetical protein
MRALVPASERHLVTEDSAKKAIGNILCCLVGHLPGRSWANSSAMIKCHSACNIDPLMEWALRGGQDQASGLTVRRACCFSNCTGLI